jgi:hypothetical protein
MKEEMERFQLEAGAQSYQILSAFIDKDSDLDHGRLFFASAWAAVDYLVSTS